MKETVISPENFKKMAISDLWEGLMSPSLWWNFSVHDIKQRFRRSVLGPFWLTLSLGIMIGTLGFINSRLFNQDIMKALPTIAIGIILWNLFTFILTEGGYHLCGCPKIHSQCSHSHQCSFLPYSFQEPYYLGA